MAVVKVESKKQLKEFILFSKRLYNNDSNYVCDNYSETYKLLVNDILKQKTITALIYEKGKQVLGRILYQYKYLEGKGKVCYFSYLDFIDNERVINELIEYMENDMKSLGITYLYGPYFNENVHKYQGVLVQGFDFPPMIYNGYNKEYYSTYLEKLGFNKTVDFLTLNICDNKRKDNDIKKIMNMVDRRYNIKITNCKEINNADKILKYIYREDNSDKRFAFDINQKVDYVLKKFDPENFIVACDADIGEGLAFCMCVPDLNEVYIKKFGKGSHKISKFAAKNIKSVKIVHMAMIEKYQQTELGTYLYMKTIEILHKKGIKKIEVGSISELDTLQMKPIRKVGGEISHVYRIYEKNLDK